MLRAAGVLLAGLALALPAVAPAADAPPAGTWKVFVPTGEEGIQPVWIVKFESKGGKWAGAVTATAENYPKAALEKLEVSGEVLRFTLKVPGRAISFEGKVPKEGDKIKGTIAIGPGLNPVHLERTALTSLDPFEVSKDTLARQADSLEVMKAAMSLLQQAAKKEAKPEEVRSWAARAIKAAQQYGPRWHRAVLADVVNVLSTQKGFESIALQYARQGERLLDAKDSPATHKQVLELLAVALDKAGKAADAKEVRARLAKLDFSIKPRPFAGRKAKSDRVVLVEFFTCAQEPKCAGAGLAFDALGKTFKPAEAVLLAYHLNMPGPDPLANLQAEGRARYYGQLLGRGNVPARVVFFNGKLGSVSGGSEGEAAERYEEYRGQVEQGLETPAKARLKLTATRKGAKIDINAEASDVKEKGDDLRLRLVLVEEEVDYKGPNLLAAHRHVVRAFPGGTDGTAVKDKKAGTTVTVDLEEVRKKLKAYADKVSEKQPFPGKAPAIALDKLSVVAFVQNDETGEVLQAARVEVPAK